MKEILKKLGIDGETISEMIEMCPEIEELTDEEILHKISMLREYNCDDDQIRDIISSNPYYLYSIDTDIIKLINKLKELGFDMINDLLEGYPYILNIDVFEIENYMWKREKKGESLEDIVDEMSGNPSLFGDV
ncbi:MAG: hypothetical protein IJG59_09795 [Erysipelotrichaceae bacterium]|nr:hypothetical protein [Erysipelotrichaceae bacterium]